MAVEQESHRPDKSSRATPARQPDEVAGDGARVDGLLVQVARGNEQAFAAVYDLVAGPVYRVVHVMVTDPGRADEIAEQVLAEVWRTASRFSPSAGSGLAWVMALVEEIVARAGTSRGDGRMARCLASLSGPQRQALLLACFGGYTYAEVAGLLRVPAGTASGWIRDGLTQLHHCLDL